MNEELEKSLHQAYMKLKSHLYNDKTLLSEKLELSKFEDNLEINIKLLTELINSRNIETLLNDIDYTLVLKKISKSFLPDNIYTNKTKDNRYDVESYNIFIKAPIQIHLISTLWTMTVGEQLDNQLLNNTKGNRLFRDKEQLFTNRNHKLFKPYFEGYQSFRDDAIDISIDLHQKNLDVTFVNLDITEFYYNISFDFNSDLPIGIVDEYRLNDFLQQVHTTFHEKIKEDNIQPREGSEYNKEYFLPIGLVSSSVIANFVLVDFDNDIVTNLKPEYYSRYVDDMLLVFSNAKIDINSETIVCDLLKCKTVKTVFNCEDKEHIKISTNSRLFTLQSEKVKVFHFEKDDSNIVLQKFKETIDKNSSFFNFMPDDEKLFKTLESSGNILFYSDSKNKISSISKTVKDTLKISRNMTGVISTVSNAKLDKKHFKDYNQQLKNI